MKYLALLASVAFLTNAAFAADVPVPKDKPVAPVSAAQVDEDGNKVDVIAPVAVTGVGENSEKALKADLDEKVEDVEAAIEDVAADTVEAEVTVAEESTEDVPEGVDAEAEIAVVVEKPVKPAVKELYTKPYVGDEVIYTTKYEDTFVQLARDNDLGFVEMRAANPYVDPWLPGDGVDIILPARHLLPDADRVGIVINLPEMRLYAFLDAYAPPVTHPIGIGREGLLTPVGSTSVTRKKESPTWTPTPRMREENPDLPIRVEPGPDNPLGTHALYLGWPTYALHGTNKPYGIGRRVSSGCIRLYPEDIASFFTKIPVGTKVTVVDQPIKAAWIDGDFYVEANLTMKQADVMEDEGGLPSYDFSDDDLAVILKTAGDYAKDMNWRTIRNVVRKRSGYPVRVYSKQPEVVDAPEQEPAPEKS